MFYFPGIQTGRELDEVEVNQINFIIKRRALRFVAASQAEWLYPEKVIPTDHWRKLDDRYLLMPDPRSLHLGGEILIGFKGGGSAAFDEYGRRPGQKGYSGSGARARPYESRALDAFQGEFARLFGRRRRGFSHEFGGKDHTEDSEDFHQYHLGLEDKYRPAGLRPRRDMRSQ
jgi:hypothetical protein